MAIRQEKGTRGMDASKVIVITGASDGIGAAAARSLAKAGHQVVLAGRSPEKTNRVAAELGPTRTSPTGASPPHSPMPLSSCPGIPQVHEQVPGLLDDPGLDRVLRGAQDRTRRLPCSITARTYTFEPIEQVSGEEVQRQDPLAWDRRNSAQPGPSRRGAGSIPASLRICQAVDGATVMPSAQARRGRGGSPKTHSHGNPRPRCSPGYGRSGRTPPPTEDWPRR